jgi:carbon-monoxide dehydrogenase medium subunit
VAHAAIRNRGTFGGSVAHADPAAELPAVLLALDAALVVAGPDGERVIPADEFFVTLFTTALNADEILTEIRFPRPAADAAWAFSEIAPRHGDFALAGSAVVVRLDGDGVVSSARVALFGVGERAVRATEAEEFLAGKRLGDADVAREAGRIAASSLDPPSDLHASGRYRKDVAAVLVKRGLLEAAAR